MKKNYILHFTLTCLLSLHSFDLLAQSTEDFESEAAGATSFNDHGQAFTISSTSGDNYDIFTDGHNENGTTDNCSGCGWNGTGTDNKFVDNAGTNNQNGTNNGTSFTISTGGVEIGITSLYLFCSDTNIGAHSGTLTITGKKSGVDQYTITKTSGFANVTTFTPNNGFTFIDFATEGASDYTQTKIDELVISGSGNLDYLALDGFSWAPGNTLSNNEFSNNTEITIYPSISSDFINVSGLKESASYNIYDVLGKEVAKGTVNMNEAIHIQDLNNGLYILLLENKITKKFIKR